MLSSSGGTPQGFADKMANGDTAGNGYQKMLGGYSNDGSGNSNTANNRVVSNLGDGTLGMQKNAPTNAIQGSIGQSNIPSGTSGFIDSGTTVTSGKSVKVVGKDKLDFNATTGTIAVGAVGIGVSIAVANIKSNTDAHIGANATIAAAPGASDTVQVLSGFQENVKGLSFGGTAGGHTRSPGRGSHRQQHAVRACR